MNEIYYENKEEELTNEEAEFLKIYCEILMDIYTITNK
jgi:hypothetical protein